MTSPLFPPGSKPTYSDLVEAVNRLYQMASQANDAKTMAQHSLEYELGNISARDAWQDSKSDNVQTGFPVRLRLYIPPGDDTRSIKRVLLSVWLDAFRSYGTAAASANLGTVSISTNTTGQSSATTTGASSTTTTGPSSITTTGASSASTTGDTVHEHVWGETDTTDADGSVGMHHHGILIDNTWGNTGHSHTMAHTHDLNHTHTLAHTHDLSHTHGIDHGHTLGSHGHALTHGIYLGTTASACTILVNSVDVTTALVGAATFSTDQTDLDLTTLVTKGLNVIDITSATLGRIDAMVFANVYLNK